MKFIYTYRSSDGQRHSAEIDAENRDAAFTKIRTELGIKPINVVVSGQDTRSTQNGADGMSAQSTNVGRGIRRSYATFLSVGVLLVAAAAVVVYWRLARSQQDKTVAAPYHVMTPQGLVTYTVATPLQRQLIPGDRNRIESARETAFKYPAERLLSRFAEPGRAVAVMQSDKPTEAEFAACLREPISIATTDFTEAVDLKRIVTGIKREMRAYINGGGTAEQYIAELSKRQRLEISYRENAEKRLEEMLSNPKEAYEYWLKANATLKSMGIYEIPIPDALKSYQAGLDLGEG